MEFFADAIGLFSAVFSVILANVVLRIFLALLLVAAIFGLCMSFLWGAGGRRSPR